MDHPSETSLDGYNNFDYVYNNEGETPLETCEAITEILLKHNT
jgi:hypothetical protein